MPKSWSEKGRKALQRYNTFDARFKYLPQLPGGGGVLDQYLGMGEPLRVWNPDPVWEDILNFSTLFKTTPSIYY